MSDAHLQNTWAAPVLAVFLDHGQLSHRAFRLDETASFQGGDGLARTLVGDCIETKSPYWRYPASQRPHKRAWIEKYGPIPAGLHVLHLCDNDRCKNVDHLYLGTHQQNMHDKVRTGKNRKTHLSVDQERELVAKYRAGGTSQRILAREYGISQAGVRLVLRRYP